MNTSANITRCIDAGSILLLVFMALVASTAPAQDWDVDWHTVDGGGEMVAETGDGQWQLSGTIGQPDGTESLAIAGSGWALTGGLWPVTVDQTDLLFRDEFESPPVAVQ